ncbi:hypothetical protein ACP0HM_31760 [Escherichia coli]
MKFLAGRFPAVKRRIRKRYKPVPMPFLNCMTTIIINPELFGAPDCNAQTEAFCRVGESLAA